MKIESIELKNIRSYGTEKVDFEDGLMLIYGNNGAGKSSLLNSIFSGLYLSDVLKYMDDDINLDSLVRRGKDKGSIKMTFDVKDNQYTIEWVISVKEDQDGNRSASSQKCVMKSDDLQNPIEGVRDVRESVVDIMGLDAESFVNSVYVQQGDITRMVNAGDQKRKEIIDGLLGLSRLDTYIGRMDKARVELGSQKRRIDELLDEKERQLNQMDDIGEVKEQLSDLKDEKSRLNDRKSKLQDAVIDARDKKSEIQDRIDEYEDIKEQYEDLKYDVKSKKEELDELDNEKENNKKEISAIESEMEIIENRIDELCDELNIKASDVGNKITELTTKQEDLRDRITTIKEGEIVRKQDRIKEIESTIDEKSTKIGDLNTEIIDMKSEVSELDNQIEMLETDIQNQKYKKEQKMNTILSICTKFDIEFSNIDILVEKQIPEQREQIFENAVSTFEELGSVKKEHDITEKIVEDGECVVCGEEHDSIDDAIMGHYDQISEDLSELEDVSSTMEAQNDELDKLDRKATEITDLQNKISINENELNNCKEKRSNINSDISEMRSEIEEMKDTLDTLKNEKSTIQEQIENQEDKLGEIQNQKQRIDDKIEKLENIQLKKEQLADQKSEINDLENEIENYDNLRDNVQQQYIESKQDLNKIEEKVKNTDVSELKSKKSEITEKLENAKDDVKSIESKLSEIQENIADRKQSKKRIEELTERCNQLDQKKIQATNQESDAESVIDTYNTVKTQLRKENIGLLNEYANEVFSSVYSNKVYQQLKITKDYDISLITGDGIEVDPKDLSGGEKTIVSLAIRAGVYKLLVKRQGSTDTLPPFILDEPTTYLDDEHVSNLQDVIDTITSWDVSQVFIVSHRDNMIQNADSAYNVTKDPKTETSKVSKEY